MSADESITSLPEAVAAVGALPMPAGPVLSGLERMQLRVDEVERAYVFDTAELKRRIAELEAERHVTNEALDDAVQALRAVRFFLADVDGGDPTLWLSEAAAREHCEAVLGTEVSGRSFDWVPDGDVCQLVFVDGLTDRVRAAGSAWVWPLAVQGPVSTAGEDGCTCPETDRVEPHWSGCPEEDAPCPVDGPIPGVGVGAGAPEMRALRAALYGPPDGEHWAAVHHSYRVPRDLPETGGAK